MLDNPLSRITCVILDWDETITEEDTMSILAKATNDPERWPEFVEAYMADMKAYEDSFGARETLNAHFEFLDGLAECEYKSVHRIEQAKAFKGTTMQKIHEVAREVRIRSGFKDFNHRLGRDVQREILSVNWSSEFISSALAYAVTTDDWIVTANQIEFDAQGSGTGGVSKDKAGGIRTGMDKLRILKQRLSTCHDQGGTLLYIGDSNTDLPALLEADIGIIFGNNESLRKNCDKYGITIKAISHLKQQKHYEKQENVLYHATTWHEITL